MIRKHFDIIFVVLVYRNTQDLKDFFAHFACENAKVIVVESYFSESCSSEFKDIAKGNNADFISVPNKGYGAGNNTGCEYALKKYDFNYLVISNADIIIQHFDMSIIEEHKDSIIAPKILNLKGKNYLFEGIINGEITEQPKGENGFGYDPIFIANDHNKTFAEMDLQEKSKISHRGIAIQKLISFLETYNTENQ